MLEFLLAAFANLLFCWNFFFCIFLWFRCGENNLLGILRSLLLLFLFFFLRDALLGRRSVRVIGVFFEMKNFIKWFHNIVLVLYCSSFAGLLIFRKQLFPSIFAIDGRGLTLKMEGFIVFILKNELNVGSISGNTEVIIFGEVGIGWEPQTFVEMADTLFIFVRIHARTNNYERIQKNGLFTNSLLLIP